MLTELPRLVPARGERPGSAGPDHPMRVVTRQIAFEPGGWTPERAVEVVEVFDGLAPEWHTRASEARIDVVADAFARGGPIASGRWLELGSGTGLLTPWLAERARLVVAVDLAAGMLARAPTGVGARVRADGARLPVADGSIDAVVLLNAFLFPSEATRVLAPHGVVVWVNSSGAGTPIHLSAPDVVAALDAGAGPLRWDAVASEAGWGTWAVARRAPLVAAGG